MTLSRTKLYNIFELFSFHSVNYIAFINFSLKSDNFYYNLLFSMPSVVLFKFFETRKNTGCFLPAGELTSHPHECIGCSWYDSNRINGMRYDDRNRISDNLLLSERNRLRVCSWDYKGQRSRYTITPAINNDQGVIRVRRRNRDALCTTAKSTWARYL